ncbi:RHTO0S16e02190g1_1 [Rhodotorula toruloides]|uniref:RHTO0S16e02190g1_1 n=2 Tax=Rhodotorula toruloides TaxID=5286 RepID=A0A061BM69_RHOTO|nr:uncharacterized protein RHTO_02251 [Rhodotorula toruloides NP11]EMS20977.1 hypothetical protein RHTO_02251 [Rhodotorula toruloides NP11]CDR48143.1 RHTO0S16e02190g1_1 [Rhodotorula toruloides]
MEFDLVLLVEGGLATYHTLSCSGQRLLHLNIPVPLLAARTGAPTAHLPSSRTSLPLATLPQRKGDELQDLLLRAHFAMHRPILRAVLPVPRSVPVARTRPTRLYSSASDIRAVHGDFPAWPLPGEGPEEEEPYNPSDPVKRLPRKYRPFSPPWLVPPPPLSFDPGSDLIALGIPKTSAEEAEVEAYRAWRTKEDRARAKKATEGMHRWRRPAGPGIHREPDPVQEAPKVKLTSREQRSVKRTGKPGVKKLHKRVLIMTADQPQSSAT